MNGRQYFTQNLLFYVIISVLSAVILVLGFIKTDTVNVELPKIEHGVIDLSNHDFSNIHLLKLTGEAEFYYNRLLTPETINDTTIAKLSGYIELSDIWNHFKINGEEIGGIGYATYRFRIKTDTSNNRYAFKIYEFVNSYKLWINGEEKVGAGIVADNKSDYTPSWKHNEVYFNLNKPENDVIIQVANFHHRKGGTEGDIIIGLADSIFSNKIKQLALNYLLIGILITMAFYHFVLYYFRKTDKSIFYFGMFNLVIMLV